MCSVLWREEVFPSKCVCNSKLAGNLPLTHITKQWSEWDGEGRGVRKNLNLINKTAVSSRMVAQTLLYEKHISIKSGKFYACIMCADMHGLSLLLEGECVTVCMCVCVWQEVFAFYMLNCSLLFVTMYSVLTKANKMFQPLWNPIALMRHTVLCKGVISAAPPTAHSMINQTSLVILAWAHSIITHSSGMRASLWSDILVLNDLSNCEVHMLILSIPLSLSPFLSLSLSLPFFLLHKLWLL